MTALTPAKFMAPTHWVSSRLGVLSANAAAAVGIMPNAAINSSPGAKISPHAIRPTSTLQMIRYLMDDAPELRPALPSDLACSVLTGNLVRG